MTTSALPPQPAPRPPVAKAQRTNRLGLAAAAYKGAPSTLCNGCGHDAITNALVRALFELGVDPGRVAKLSGIGCSSKTTAYFLAMSHGLNAVHGRMAAIATGVALANRRLILVGVSGDGDTASIGLGHFLHMVRRNVPMLYVLENNGCYGLTKGQFSATADRGAPRKGGAVNRMPPIDCCALAVEMGCGYVARTFSGDARQIVALLQGGLAHRGTAFVDVVSPCVTFNNHDGSTKSYAWAKEHEDPIHEVGFVPHFDPIEVDYEPGQTRVVALHDGSRITLRKLGRDHDPTSRRAAIDLLDETAAERSLLTGLIFHDPSAPALDEQLDLVPEPLAMLPADRLRPPPEALAEAMAELR